MEQLNFWTTPELKKKLKLYCVYNDTNMSKVLNEFLEKLDEHHDIKWKMKELELSK